MSDPMRVAILISGGGTTMERILTETKLGGLLHNKIKVVLVISSKSGVKGIGRAADADVGLEIGKSIFCVEPSKHRGIFGKTILDLCRDRGVDFIGQYGWGVKTPTVVVKSYQGMIVNQHPGPLRTGRPGFGGKGMLGTAVHAAVLWFARSVERDFLFTEAVAHRVTEEYDEGAVLKVAQIPIEVMDDVSDLQQRVLPVEHEVQVMTLLDFAQGRVVELNLPEIVLQSELVLLEEAKRTAKILFPHG